MVVKRNARKRVTKKEIGEFTHNEFTAFIGVPFHHMGGPITSEKLLGALEITQSMSVLDVGCGSGYTPCLIAKRYRCNVIGVDISEYMISKANELAAEERLENVTFRVADAHKLPFNDEEFDIIIAESVLMFIPDKQPVLHELLRVLKPNGYIGNLESCLKPNLP